VMKLLLLPGAVFDNRSSRMDYGRRIQEFALSDSLPVMQYGVEEPIAQVVRSGEAVYCRVGGYCKEAGDAVPSRIYIKAWGMKGMFRCLAIVENVPSPPPAVCQ
jgi:hypothetical protein